MMALAQKLDENFEGFEVGKWFTLRFKQKGCLSTYEEVRARYLGKEKRGKNVFAAKEKDSILVFKARYLSIRNDLVTLYNGEYTLIRNSAKNYGKYGKLEEAGKWEKE